MIEDSGHLFGQPDYTRLNNAKWYQKIYAKLNYKYKQTLIDIKPLKAFYNGNGCYEVVI